ncbi:MAG: MBL fold metallo-hydrolase [Burkholderiaceae bacterium]|jgi:recombination protein RecT|nr:MBL fold metallo-hydrolase [Burkholderiales bacterium]MCZ8338796.1 MBL fold metallo-hydrolase [Burkholderiaceae bacterium]
MNAPVAATTFRREKLLHGWREPVVPRPAATILLLRDSAEGLQVLMTRRSSTASFAPGAYVFPGGALDEADKSDAAVDCARARADQDDPHRHYAAAALREAFEELGVLLAYRRGTDEPVDPAAIATMDRTHDGDLYAQLTRAGLELAIDRTGWLSHWITDRDLPKRFDVRFFVAPMPAGQEAIADGAEQFEPVWVNPADALARHEQGTFSMIFPTIRTLRQLQRFGTVAQVLEACRAQTSVFTSCPRGGKVAGKDTRFTEDEMAFGELEMVSPDGQVVHALDWRTDEVVRLRRNVLRLTAPNPGMMTGPGTNTYIVGEDGAWIVIDPGPPDRAHVERIAAAVRGGLQAIVCTHSHPDHSPAAPMLREALGRDVPILGLASRPTARAHSSFVPDRELADGERLRVGDSTLRVVHTPGHAANHLCLVLEEDRLLFSGDHVLNGSTTVVDPPDGNMREYLDSLERLAAEPVDFILPAHGHVLAPAVGAMRKLVAHRLGREAKVAGALARSGGGTLDDLVPSAYDDVKPALFPVAKRSLLAHLEKLVEDGRARRDGERWLPA